MLTLQDLSFEFGGRWLYRNVTWQLQAGDRVGLVGKNGTGKSTLLRLINGEYTPTEGLVSRSADLKIGFLTQDSLSQELDEPLFNFAQRAFVELLDLEQKIERLTEAVGANPDDMDLLMELADAQTEYEIKGGYTLEARTHEILDGLGFTTDVRQNPLSTFSGGWRMRALLAKLLLQNPDILLLDEPTNHLDLPSIQWLEQYLQGFPGAVIVVSHDRYFLDRLTNRIVEINAGRLHFYTGNYQQFLDQKTERMTIHQAAFNNQQKFIEESERFINRFKAKASKASQAQSRIKMLEKLERIEPMEDDNSVMRFRFPPCVRAGETVLGLKVDDMRYGDDKVLFHNTQAEIRRGEKIGLIGPNGQGKSTLLRMLDNRENFQGSCQLGYNVTTALYAQHQLEMLDPKNTIWDSFSEESLQKGDPVVRNILGCFLFSGDTIEKKISVLSGGEKARVALAKTLLRDANFLMLDEPTNHLDMASIQLLTEALNQYDGTYVIVSHDRFFLSAVTNTIWYIENREIKVYPGGYAEFAPWYAERQRKAAQDTKQAAQGASAAKTPPPPPAKAPEPAKVVVSAMPQPQPAAPTASSPAKKGGFVSREAKAAQNKVKKLEEQIDAAELKRAQLLEEMAKPEVVNNYGHLQALQADLKKLDEGVEMLMIEWETAQAQAEELLATT